METEKEIISEDWQDILGNGDFRRKILTLSPDQSTKTKPINGDNVVINCTERLVLNEEITDIKNDYEFILGDGDVLPVIDMGVKLMYPGETSLFVVKSRFAYGKYGREHKISSDSKMSFEITLLEVNDGPDYEKIPPQELLSIVEAKKNRGNWWYGRDEYGYAIDSYSRGIKLLENFENALRMDIVRRAKASEKGEVGPPNGSIAQDARDNSSLMAQRDELELMLYNNLAAAQLKMEALDAALRSLDHVLSLKPTDIKALYRKSKVLTGKGDIGNALSILESLIEMEPHNKAFVGDALHLAQIKLQQDKAEKLMCERMFNSPLDSEQLINTLKPLKTHKSLKSLSNFYNRLKIMGAQRSNFVFMILVALTSILFMFVGAKYMDWMAPGASSPR